MELRLSNTCRECWLVARRTRATARTQPVKPWLQHLPTRTFSIHITPSHQELSSSHRRDQPVHHRRFLATTSSPKSGSSLSLQELHIRVNELCASALRPEDARIPSEQRVLYVLEQLEALAKSIQGQDDAGEQRKSTKSTRQTATSALLGSVNARQSPALISRALVLNTISSGAEQILRDQNVYLTAAILKAYVDLQCLLRRPSSFPHIFHLYAQKPSPRQSSSGEITHERPSSFASRHPSSAVPAGIASDALDCAIAVHDLGLAVEIIETSYATASFRNAKIIREAGLPIAGVTTLPFALWALSSQIGYLSPALSHTSATNMAFAGFMTYATTVGVLGYITITTSNDQMERVTWAQGIPLWERWMREDERRAVDKIAQAWGFKNEAKRGEEVGDDWQLLREWVGMRSMVLDRVSLMEGME